MRDFTKHKGMVLEVKCSNASVESTSGKVEYTRGKRKPYILLW